MSNISKEQVEHVSKLANIPLKEGEAEIFAEMFSDTISYINILTKLDTSNIGETYQVTGLVNVYQKDDENIATLTQEEALKNVKQKERGLVVTKGVFSKE